MNYEADLVTYHRRVLMLKEDRCQGLEYRSEYCFGNTRPSVHVIKLRMETSLVF